MDSQEGGSIFAATMSLKTFKKIARVIRFDNRYTRSERRLLHTFALIRESGKQWVEILPNPSENVTIDKQLVSFKGRYPFRQYIPSKPAKYGILRSMESLCDSATRYA